MHTIESDRGLRAGRTACVLALFLRGLAGPARAAEPTPPPPGYRVAQTLRVTRARDGVTGTLQRLIDERLTAEVEAELDPAYFSCVAVPPEKQKRLLRPFCASMHQKRLAPLRLRLLDPSGRVLDSRTFERERGLIEVRQLYGEKPRAFSLMVDLGVGMGSYNGPMTWFFDLRTGRLRWLLAPFEKGGRENRDPEENELRVLSSLRTAWRLAPAPEGRNLDVLAVICHPDYDPYDEERNSKEGLPLEVTYQRFHFDGVSWVRHERSEPGFWEAGDYPFPPRSKFP